MYKKNFKHRKITHNPDHSNVSGSFRTATNEVNQSMSLNQNFPTKLNLTNLRNNRKRKSLFDDFDLSDLKLDANLPSFTDVSKSFSIVVSMEPSNNEINNISNEDQHNNSLHLDDIDFEEDLLLNNVKDQAESQISLTDEDKNAMIELVKSNLKTSTESTKRKHDIQNNNDESYSYLLEDDFELNDDDIMDLESQLIRIKSNNSKDEDETKNNENEFRTAAGSKIPRPEKCSFERSRQMFLPIESILIKEIVCYIWNCQQQNS